MTENINYKPVDEQTYEYLIDVSRGWKVAHKCQRPTKFTYIVDGMDIVSFGTDWGVDPTRDYDFRYAVSDLADAVNKIKWPVKLSDCTINNLPDLVKRTNFVRFKLSRSGKVVSTTVPGWLRHICYYLLNCPHLYSAVDAGVLENQYAYTHKGLRDKITLPKEIIEGK